MKQEAAALSILRAHPMGGEEAASQSLVGLQKLESKAPSFLPPMKMLRIDTAEVTAGVSSRCRGALGLLKGVLRDTQGIGCH